jgi:hypothetical protein
MRNPDANRLPEGVTEQMLLEAVERSGYPLQTTVAAKLSQSFRVQQEWAYIDSESGVARAADVLADRELYKFTEHRLVRPHLVLIVECKRSDLPIVFFESPSAAVPPDFPRFAGLKESNIPIVFEKTMDGTYSTPIAELLSLGSTAFVRSQIPSSAACAGSARKGKGLELTGADIFQSVTHTLSKAARHFVRNSLPPTTAVYFDLYAVLCIAVFDAPMFVVKSQQTAPTVKPAPWVRLIRHEHDEAGSHRVERDRSIIIDAVHVEFLPELMSDYLDPLGETLGKNVKVCEKVLARGSGVAVGAWNDQGPLHERVRGDRFGAKALAMLKLNE